MAIAANTVNNNVVVSDGTAVKVGRKSYTLESLISHVVAQWDTLSIMDNEKLDLYRSIGTSLLAIRSLYLSDKLFGKAVAGTDLGQITMQARNDMMRIAADWETIKKMNTKGVLQGLGHAAIVKRLRAELSKDKAPTSAGNVSKGKVKATDAAKAEPKANVSKQEQDPKVFAAYVIATIEAKGWNRREVLEEIAKLIQKGK